MPYDFPEAPFPREGSPSVPVTSVSTSVTILRGPDILVSLTQVQGLDSRRLTYRNPWPHETRTFTPDPVSVVDPRTLFGPRGHPPSGMRSERPILGRDFVQGGSFTFPCNLHDVPYYESRTVVTHTRMSPTQWQHTLWYWCTLYFYPGTWFIPLVTFLSMVNTIGRNSDLSPSTQIFWQINVLGYLRDDEFSPSDPKDVNS